LFPMTAQWSSRTSLWTTPSPAPTTPPTWWTRLPLTRGKQLCGTEGWPPCVCYSPCQSGMFQSLCKILSPFQSGHCSREEREHGHIWKPIVSQLLHCKSRLPLHPVAFLGHNGCFLRIHSFPSSGQSPILEFKCWHLLPFSFKPLYRLYAADSQIHRLGK
jgi:hypothetical protein